MTNDPSTIDQLIEQARVRRVEREDLEIALEKCRRHSRSLAIQLIFEHHMSLAKVSALTGHMRPTLRVWIESEIARRGEAGKTSPRIL